MLRAVVEDGTERETFTMRLEGDRVTLDTFTAALQAFHRSIRDAIGERRDRVEVVVEALSSGSAYVTAALEFRTVKDQEAVSDRIYTFASAAQQGDTGQLSQRMAHHVEQVHEVLERDDVVSIHFATSTHDFFLQPVDRPPADHTTPSRPSSGEVRGRIETIARRSRRFLIYDLLHDTPVTCYLASEDEERIRGLWGKLARVTGTVIRDPVTDRPASIRQITDIASIDEGDPNDWRAVIGALPADVPGVPFDLNRYLDEDDT
jgi:hypothetical protein